MCLCGKPIAGKTHLPYLPCTCMEGLQAGSKAATTLPYKTEQVGCKAASRRSRTSRHVTAAKRRFCPKDQLSPWLTFRAPEIVNWVRCLKLARANTTNSKISLSSCFVPCFCFFFPSNSTFQPFLFLLFLPLFSPTFLSLMDLGPFACWKALTCPAPFCWALLWSSSSASL